jgi:hypothetical protein
MSKDSEGGGCGLRECIQTSRTHVWSLKVKKKEKMVIIIKVNNAKITTQSSGYNSFVFGVRVRPLKVPFILVT